MLEPGDTITLLNGSSATSRAYLLVTGYEVP
jgi:hypothetical protein